MCFVGRVKPGRADKIRESLALLEAALRADPYAVQVLTAHYIRWAFFDNDTRFMYNAVFDTDFDKYCEDFVGLFNKYSPDNETAFDHCEGCPPDWRTNLPAFVKWGRENCAFSSLEYAEYPGYTCEDVKKALTLKDAFGEMLDQMQ